jgi:pyruvate, water dikinase
MASKRSFAIPAEMQDIPGTEGWREMYHAHQVFAKDKPAQVEFESSRFWFLDSVHNPYPLSPLDSYRPDMWRLVLAQAANRIYLLPPARGLNQRILNGYLYLCPEPVTDPEEIGRRVPEFQKRAGHYYQHWDEIFEGWGKKVDGLVNVMESIHFVDLPDVEPESTVFETKGYGQSYRFLNDYSRFWDTYYLLAQYHFELLNLAYGADAVYIESMHKLFPDITDNAIGKTVAGFDSKLFRPPEELQKLAKLALDSGLAEAILSCKQWQEVPEKLGQTEAGKGWLDAFEKARYPWFEMSCGLGWYHHEPTWNQNLDVPLTNIRRYIETLKMGKPIARPRDKVVEERNRVTAEYRSLIRNEADLETFNMLSGIAAKVAPYSEDHNWYWSNYENAIFCRKMRELGEVFVNHKIIKEADDIFCFNRFEIPQVLYDMAINWASGTPPVASYTWPDKVARRKEILERFKEWQAPPALGPAPEVVAEPITIAMFGITTERINDWLDAKEVKHGEIKNLTGFAASPGVAEGPARVCKSPDEIAQLRIGEILVASTTSPTWAPAFQSINGCVTDIGGTFSHAAIVAREYNMPAVLGTGFATQAIRTGDMIRVDGNKGVVTILQTVE